jgi:hypothetical protein
MTVRSPAQTDRARELKVPVKDLIYRHLSVLTAHRDLSAIRGWARAIARELTPVSR